MMLYLFGCGWLSHDYNMYIGTILIVPSHWWPVNNHICYFCRLRHDVINTVGIVLT